jgi:hypothetical protein
MVTSGPNVIKLLSILKKIIWVQEFWSVEFSKSILTEVLECYQSQGYFQLHHSMTHIFELKISLRILEVLWRWGQVVEIFCKIFILIVSISPKNVRFCFVFLKLSGPGHSLYSPPCGFVTRPTVASRLVVNKQDKKKYNLLSSTKWQIKHDLTLMIENSQTFKFVNCKVWNLENNFLLIVKNARTFNEPKFIIHLDSKKFRPTSHWQGSKTIGK